LKDITDKIIKYLILTFGLVFAIHLSTFIVCLFAGFKFSIFFTSINLPLCSGMLISSFSSLFLGKNYDQIREIRFSFWLMTFMNIVFIGICAAFTFHSNMEPDSIKLIAGNILVFLLTVTVTLLYKIWDFK